MPLSRRTVETDRDLQTKNARDPIITGCLEACRRCCTLVDQLSDQEYNSTSKNHSSIGAHMRHCLEHFICFFQGIEEGCIDYDARERDERIETQRTVFYEVIGQIQGHLSELDRSDLPTGLELHQLPAPNSKSSIVNTTIERELLFLTSHTVHHIALMEMLAELGGVKLSKTVGKAYSTEKHEQDKSEKSVSES